MSNISYNHLNSQSYIFDDDDTNKCKHNESFNSSKSDKILYRNSNNINVNNNTSYSYSRPLRYDQDSIQSIQPIDYQTTSESESDTENINTTNINTMPSFNDINISFTKQIQQQQNNRNNNLARLFPKGIPKYRLKFKRNNKKNTTNGGHRNTVQPTGFVLRAKQNRNKVNKSQQMLRQYKTSKLVAHIHSFTIIFSV